VEILAQSSTAFVLTHNFQGTHILGASRGRLSDSVASCIILLVSCYCFTSTLCLIRPVSVLLCLLFKNNIVRIT